MSVFRFPSVFLSHGTPMLAFGEDPFFEQLKKFTESLPRPKALVVVSAHSISSESVHILKTQNNTIQHDYSGFPRELYQVQYSCRGSPWFADEIAALFKAAHFDVKIESEAPLDHGIWIPLLGMYPDGSVPVVRVSLPIHLIPAQILKMGHAVAKLREQGVMIIGTGGAVHNLNELSWSEKNGQPAPWAVRFENWIVQTLQQKNVDQLLGADENPDFFKAHPTSEHFSPIYFVIGAALPQDEFQLIYRKIEYSSLSMLSFFLNPSPLSNLPSNEPPPDESAYH